MPEAVWLPPTAQKPPRSRVVQRILVVVGVAVVLVVVVVGGGYLGYRHITRVGDDNGHSFRDALVRVAASDGLREPIAVSQLAPFEWDAVAVGYPYSEDYAREDVGEDSKELPDLGENGVAVYFIRNGRLAGWLLTDHETDKAVGVDTRTCLRLDAPAPRRRAYLVARRGKLIFTTASGPRTRSAPGYCP